MLFQLLDLELTLLEVDSLLLVLPHQQVVVALLLSQEVRQTLNLGLLLSIAELQTVDPGDELELLFLEHGFILVNRAPLNFYFF